MDQLSDESNACFPNKSIVHNLLKCPACSADFDKEENCFEHFLDHFEYSKDFFFKRCDLVFWLNDYVCVASEVFASRKIKINNLDEVENTHHCAESTEMRTYFCKTCNISFPNEDQICVHDVIHFKVKVPAINRQLKCPLCDRYFCRREPCLMHIFTHMKIPIIREIGMELCTVEDPFQFIERWITVFCCVRSRVLNEISLKYTLYKQRLNSPLLSKILWTEITALKNCKFCHSPVSSVIDLLDNHCDCKPCDSIRPVFCVICNFKAIDMNLLMCHFFSDHVICYCGYRGSDFDTFMKHSKECIAQKRGVICPCCHVQNFVTEEAFKQHIEGTKRNSCGSHLKKNKWACVICKKQCSQKNMFDHILTEHVSCVCGYKSKSLKYFFIHTAKCVQKKRNIVCPICRKTMCSTEVALKQHVCCCFPWKEPKQDQRNNSSKRSETGKEILKRKHNQSFVEIPSKKIKFSFALNYVNCTSQ